MTVTMDADKAVTAVFAEESVTPVKYTLAVNKTGEGSVALSPAGGSYDAGTIVTLTATPAAGWKFSQWTGATTGTQKTATITMNGNKTVTAVFVKESYTLTVNKTGEGSVALSPAGGSYEAGTTVTLTATPAAGWKFSQWTGAATGTQKTATITMNGNKTVTAVFVEDTSSSTLPMPFTENFNITDADSFFSAVYRSMPGVPGTPLYYCLSGASRITINNGQMTLNNSRFAIGDKSRGVATLSGVIPNGSLDLSRPYRIKFNIIAFTGTGNFQVFVDNNTTSAGNSIHANIGVTASRLLHISGSDITSFPYSVVIESTVGTATSFIQFRADSNVTSITIDDLVIEYQ